MAGRLNPPQYCAHCARELVVREQPGFELSGVYTYLVCPMDLHRNWLLNLFGGPSKHTRYFVGWSGTSKYDNYDIYTGKRL